MHDEHKGHEAMHAEMIIIFFVTLIVGQFILIEWKRRHYKSYSVSTEKTHFIKIIEFLSTGLHLEF